MRLKDKVAIVTGGGSGFGEAIAKRFAAEGAKVVVADLRGEAATRVASEIGSAAIAVTADVARADDVAAVAEAAARLGTPQILVNNAGTTHRNQPLLETDEISFDRVFNVNVKSIYHFVQAVVPIMRDAGGGVILNVGSTAGIRPRPGLTWYNASKGAVNLMSRSLAVELAPWKIRVNALCPVAAETPLLEALLGVPDTPENRQKFIASIPLGRLCRPSDVAAAAVYLASDEAEFITGVELPIDGGRTI
ncbi:glucose 1-dehydrogenase [Bradyrhizobium sp. LVM 105]|uniref:glucose 1-dehydrogenase n=1 Tax=Bradyrhizobium sp. LVM 105 TaxID=2341115 RepID=UPI000F806A0C|nr:glucose 1-dehydrogenase [Bradyrhizobium sp. LVM 105]RTE91329.1 glucose 1-dehydrogenase [Bradyrhizobium sp. LVM 105]